MDIKPGYRCQIVETLLFEDSGLKGAGVTAIKLTKSGWWLVALETFGYQIEARIVPTTDLPTLRGEVPTLRFLASRERDPAEQKRINQAISATTEQIAYLETQVAHPLQ